MKTLFFFIVLCAFSAKVSCQNEAANWYFGDNAGIKFNNGSTTVTNVNNSQITTPEGCASISDKNGNLLFYTDGITIWNINNLPMINGTNLNGDPSSTQSAIIVPYPNNNELFYVFTVDNLITDIDPINNGLNYSIVDMSRNGGMGEVTLKNINLIPQCSEKITAVSKGCNEDSIWLIAYASDSGTNGLFDTFYAFEITATGINTTPVKSKFNSGVLDGRGYLKLSPDGTKVACANTSNGVYLYDFDIDTGIVSNQYILIMNAFERFPYAVEFSPNSQLLYANYTNDFFGEGSDLASSHSSSLVQFNLAATNIQDSMVIIDNRQLYRGALQLGPDRKIYRALSATYLTGLPYLGVIDNPNTLGTACNYIHNAIDLSPYTSRQGLPPFITSFFSETIDIIKNGDSSNTLNLCEGDTYKLQSVQIPNATYSWSINGVTIPNNSYDLDVPYQSITIPETGTLNYEVFIETNTGDCPITGQAFVSYNTNPATTTVDLFQCNNLSGQNNTAFFNLLEANNELTGGNPDFSVLYYLDAQKTIPISTPEAFESQNIPLTITASITNRKTLCSADSQVTLELSAVDIGDITISICDYDGVNDGFYKFSLNDISNEIAPNLPSGIATVLYETFEDALLERNPLENNYTNTSAYNQTIFARSENNNACYGIAKILLQINQPPLLEEQGKTSYCTNFFPDTITIDAGLLEGNISDFSYNWSTGNDTYEIEINTPGNFNVTVTDLNTLCSSERTVTVNASEPATFLPFKINDAAENNSITVYATGDGTYQYSLIRDDDNFTIPYQDSNTFNNLKPGIYTVLARDIENNCGISEEKVSIIGFPKYFTPNNDGKNDTWQIYGVSNMFQANTKIKIFDRYGKLIKEIPPLGTGWNGLVNGQALPADDYWFSVTLQDGRIFKNHFTLKK